MPPTRRNLFQSHLTRRPTPGAASTSTSVSHSSNNNSTASTSVPNDALSDGASQSAAIQSTASSRETSVLMSTSTDNNGGDIIARDKNGNFQLDIPVLPPLPPDEEADEETMEGIEEGRPSGGSGSSGANASGVDSEIGGRDKEKFEANLIEMVQRSRGRHLSTEPEILNLIQQSLRAKVASLDEDNWMFEVEDDSLA
ncbi:uncharacterized protein TRUGW13939_07239 [Talaromyces rugulosus]|uniref:Uncharacterized protein n=1 Tax=Talaromyces rugulosus TaxID=121627 RepID=A0A7H8R1M1_TALRU|nr:uncharacterized protein TRUGW13939_07239 [Talaromyces rugulosus]QKX60097.1 hypothetical protein TRUGW13939_07239 [Talaromyces rugulosus]